MALPDLHTAPPAVSAAARAAIVNRTHRVVRERAEQMQKRKKSRRELVLPLLICSAVLLLVCYAGWVVASGSGFGAVGSEIEERARGLWAGQTWDAGGMGFLLLLWFLPVSVVTIGVLFVRRGRGLRDGGGERLQRPTALRSDEAGR